MAAKKKQRRGNVPPRGQRETSRSLLRNPGRYVEWFCVAALLVLLVFFLVLSWRKWPDPLIDFGRELYIPWRISHGAVLYRDLEEHYGPLSQYFNGLLFKVFGPGLMVLVAANLVLLLGILSLLYLLCRRAWGAAAAFAATGIFISVFSMSQLIGISNYNYLAPYAHETTHGILVSLALVMALCQWIERPTWRWSALAGLLYGLCLILKPEFIFAGALVIAVAVAIRLRHQSAPAISSIVAGFGAAVFPTLAFAAFFAGVLPWRLAWRAAFGAWWRFATEAPRDSAGGIQAEFTGLNRPTNHLLEHAIAVLIACLVIGLVTGVVWLLRKNRYNSLGTPIILALLVAVAWLSWQFIHWVEVGKCLLGLTIVYIAGRSYLIFLRKQPLDHRELEPPRLLLSVLAAALLVRMALNGRIYQYGFFQAAIAGSVLPAILVSELPQWLRASARERWVLIALLGALLVPGIARIASSSQEFLRLKTASIGDGTDQFYTFPRQVEPTGEIVAAVAASLNQGDKPKSLLVLPEGILINYLTRIPCHTPFYFYLASSPGLIAAFESNPPECVVVISRNLREYGIERYGEKPGQGKEIVEWLSQHYRQYAHAGGDPFDVRHRGAIFYRRNKTL